MKLILVILLLNSAFINAQNISSNEIFEIIKHYPQNNYIGAFGSSDMKPMHSGYLRDFGIYRKAKINIIPEKIKENILTVSGKLAIDKDLKTNFSGEIVISKIESSYRNNDDFDNMGNLIKDSILLNTIEGNFDFILNNNTRYSGALSILIEKTKTHEWIFHRSGIVLFGNYNNKSLNFGNITPPSNGIFRTNPKDYSKICINKNLMKFGWETYILSKPEYFNCTFDSFSDEIEYLTEDKNQTLIYLQLESEELK